jgi:NitT/TauT family transport system substrate-binding protein
MAGFDMHQGQTPTHMVFYQTDKEVKIEMKWKQVVLGSALTAALFSLAACSGNGGDTTNKVQKAEEVRLTEVIRSIFYAPQYVAIEKGYFKEEGLDVKLDTAWGGDKAMTRLLAGQADVALIGAETTVFVEQQGSADTVVNFAQATQRDGSFIVARNKIDNWDWNLLKGKSIIGSRKGSMPEMTAEFVYRQHGIEPFQDVNIIQNITFDNQAAAFVSGTGDFFQAFEPNASILEKAGQGHVVAAVGQDSGTLPYTVFMSKASYQKSHPETIQKFTNAIQKAQDFVHRASAEEIADVIKPYFDNVDQEIIVRVVKRYQDSDAWPKDTLIDTQEFDHMKEIMKQAGELKSDVPYEKVVTTQFAENARK